MAYGKSNNLIKRTQSDKVLKYKAFKIANNPNYDGYQRGLASVVYKIFDQKSASLDKSKGSGIINEPNYQLANELHKPIIRKLKKIKVYSSFRNNIWGFDLADMQSLSKYNKGIKYLLCVIDLFSKYAWVVPIKDKKGTSIVNAFKKIISEGSEANSKGQKTNKIWVDQGSEFYNKPFKDFLKINNVKMYSYNEGKSLVAERFIRTLKNKIFKHMTAISKNVYFDVLDDIVDKYNNTVHRTIKIKCIEVTGDYYAGYNEDPSNKKNPKFKVGGNVRISKHKNIFAKGYTQNWSEVFIINKIKNTIPWTYAISDLNGGEITGSFYEKELQKTSQKEFRIEKVFKRKGNKLYVKWKGYNNSFNSWINKKDLL